MIFNLSMPVLKPKVPTASLTAQSGVSYTNGLNGLEADVISLFSAAISNNSAITDTTSTVYIDFGSVHQKVSVGDQVTLSLDGTDYAFDIIGFNHDTLTDSMAYGEETATGKAGMTLQMHDLFATKYSMNGSAGTTGGWKNSSMRSRLEKLFLGWLPSDLQSVIKAVNKQTSVGSKRPTIETVSDKLFLLSEVEIFGSTDLSFAGEGSQYAWYKAGNTRVKNVKGSAGAWWDRSPSSGNSAYFCCVSGSGNFYSDKASDSHGVSFGFCV